jgi:uncharacterized protein (DUF885 family)
MADTLRLPAADVAADVDRVITFPAQAVAPVYGYVNIRDLRQLAESRLGWTLDSFRLVSAIVKLSLVRYKVDFACSLW